MNLSLERQEDTVKRYRVLIVEDRKTLAKEIAASLEGEKDLALVGIAYDVNEAIELTGKYLPDVVLLDLDPFMTGIQAIQLIKQQKPEIEIVVLTVREDDDALFEALKVGAKGYLLKSSPTSQIGAALRSVAGGESAISPALGRKVLVEFERLSHQSSSLLSLFEKLSRTELTVLSYLAEGKTNSQIARAMSVELTTVKNHLTCILRKLAVSSRFEAACIARRSGLGSPTSHRGNIFTVNGQSPGERSFIAHHPEAHAPQVRIASKIRKS